MSTMIIVLMCSLLLGPEASAQDLSELPAPNTTILSKLFNVTEKQVAEVIKKFTFEDVKKDDVIFYQFLPNGETKNITSPDSLDPDRNTVFITHGYQSSGTTEWVGKMADALHRDATGKKHNVVGVDWSEDAGKGYIHAASSTESVGAIIGDFIVEMLKRAKSASVQLVGHSLGAHVSGFAGKRVRKETGRKVGRISGLDAAGPLFEGVPPTRRLSKDDAEFVDGMHTQLILLGMISSYATIDYYVEFAIQPICTNSLVDILNFIVCGHGASHEYFTDSVLHPDKYKSYRCASFAALNSGGCKWNTEIVSFWKQDKEKGIFYTDIEESDKKNKS